MRKFTKPNKRLLAKETTKWYKKLQSEGFSDIEWFDTSTGYGQNTPYLKHGAARILQKYSTETAQHYQICSQFAESNRFDRCRDKFCFKLYCEGITFREIIKRARRKGTDYYYDRDGKQILSLFSLHHLIKKYIKRAYDWNKTSPEGLASQSEQSLLDQMNEENVLNYGTSTQDTFKWDDDGS